MKSFNCGFNPSWRSVKNGSSIYLGPWLLCPGTGGS
jgi:hypothetical protein